ncbi:nitrilase [Roseovarius sp. LXJ103]|uniref:nitrilase-related carbon-nitrogen hydrolase n=1 Tax=Roseovarius carneus TaxID=2853164 RepID=UPI000D614F0E|nr:nitrilase-related carbon-nitrogen hydrolase [Roseovarius carneus]MBZ8117076.1 nitrilase [Roseovarius carneus]PWE37075.1 hydrolase [Pelagicola sp. LXJ1103]
MKLAAFQMSAATPHPERLPKLEAAIREAASAGAGADLIIAPELCLSGYGRGPEMAGLAQGLDGEWATRIGTLSDTLGIAVIAGFPERAGETRYISALIKLPGAAPQAYRKGTLYGDYERSIFTSAGPSTVIVEIAGLKVGVLICYDVEFPENTRRLAMAGADLIAVPTALPWGGMGEASGTGSFVVEHLVPTRACENVNFVAYVNNSDSDERFEFQGESVICAPNGGVLAKAPRAGDTLMFADIDPRAYDAVRAYLPYPEDVGPLL